MSVRAYLTRIRERVDSPVIKEPLKFVSGNQSSDIDSVICAIAYSYMHNLKNKSDYLIPLINIPRRDISFRRDIVKLLDSQQISIELLYFVEDFTRLISNSQESDLVLVDHCNIQGIELQQAFKYGALNVSAIIDHHEDEQEFLNVSPRVIKPSGLCSSLVFNYWFTELGSPKTIDTLIIELLLGPLVIDTSCMSAKVEPDDLLALNRYNSIFGETVNVRLNGSFLDSTTSSALETLYNGLKKAKKDLDGFSFSDILRKDYKQFDFGNGHIVGFSSIEKSIWWISKHKDQKDVSSSVCSIIKKFGLSLLVITTSFTNKLTGQYTRELVLAYPESLNYVELPQAMQSLQLESTQDMECWEKQYNGCSNIHFKAFNQRDLKASRKKIVPAVKSALERESTP